MKILVTGAGGYIGTTLVPLLLSNGHHVKAVDRFFFGKELLNTNDNLEFVYEDARHIKPEEFHGIDAVIDLVAISNDPSGEAFQKQTYEINHESRFRTAKLAKEAGVSRYILPSSASIYGFQDKDFIANETSKTNPLTTYAIANEMAEKDILPLASDDFCVVVLRQSTVYGYSPRMRMDLAINGMTYGAWKTGKLPLMRDGTQWRPMVHVKDTARAQMFMLDADITKVNGEIFNVGSDENSYQLKDLAERVCKTIGDVEIEWYGDEDLRSYRVSFEKIEALGYKAEKIAEDGVKEILEKLESGELDKTSKTITLEWYQELAAWHKKIKEVEKYGGMLDI